ncbi:MAG: PDZ domain-containing protein [Phycisphaerales bacterium]|nr:PDZ domain-containing protein [Phycisphaerales bacterium]
MKITDPTHLKIRPGVLVAIVGLSIASAAVAQSEKKEAEEPKVRGEFGKPLGGDEDQMAGSSVMTISRSNDGQTYTVTIKDGKVSAEVNGKPVPEDRIERRRDAIIIKDENGKEATRFDVGRAVRGGRVLRLDNAPWLQLSPQMRENGIIEIQPQLRGQFQPETPPPVMLGVTMSDADEAVLEHLNYESGVMVDRVLEGLPAAKAGVEVGDIIVEFNGQKPIEQETIRAKLREAKPGDEISLKVIRKGKAQDVKIKLDAYDAEKLGHVWNQGDANAQQWWGQQGRGDGAADQLRESLKMLEGIKGMSPEQTKQLHDAMNDAIKRLENSNAFTWRIGPRGNGNLQLDPNAPIVIGRNQDQIFEVPGSSDLSRKIDKLNSTIDKLTDRIERLEKQLKEKSR